MKLQEKAEQAANRVFLGGPPEFFEEAGRLQLITLLKEGLYPSSVVLDIGCGCLRGGYWLIHFLNKGCYSGIEPNKEMLDIGMSDFLGNVVCKEKSPAFDCNDQFDSSVFGKKFNFFVARSIWTHASKKHIGVMLDAFVRDSTDDGVFLTSYLPPTENYKDYSGAEWIGRSHESIVPGLVYHDFNWIKSECSARGLEVMALDHGLLNRQVWLKVSKG